MTRQLILALAATAAAMTAADPAAATLQGRVTDASGAPVAGAIVVISEPGGLAQRRVTGEEGWYNFGKLPPASYSVRISKPGFRTYEAPKVVVNGAARLDRKLSVPGPVRAIETAQGENQQPAPDLRALLRAGLQRPWDAAPPAGQRFDYSAPEGGEEKPAADAEGRVHFEPLVTASAAPVGISLRVN